MHKDPDCIFCRIVAGELPSEKLYEDSEVLCFRDINPQAPFHGILIPKTHIATLNNLRDDQAELMGRFFVIARDLAARYELAGYRVAVNTNPEGGQVVYHVHMHILGGRQMQGSLG